MDSGCRRVEKIVLYKGEAAVVYAWGHARRYIEELLRQKAERVAYVNRVGMLAEGLREDVELDPSAVWQVRVRGRGVYQPIVERLGGTVKALTICFYASPP